MYQDQLQRHIWLLSLRPELMQKMPKVAETGENDRVFFLKLHKKPPLEEQRWRFFRNFATDG